MTIVSLGVLDQIVRRMSLLQSLSLKVFAGLLVSQLRECISYWVVTTTAVSDIISKLENEIKLSDFVVVLVNTLSDIIMIIL